MKQLPSSTQRSPANEELGLCITCTSVVLLGNGWTVLVGMPTEVAVAYAAASSVLAMLANTAAVCRVALQTRIKH